jgi:tRNA threonylcarbamoyl adenosine modification protein (Sua5/YciO/YrdC/YwlC family)
VTPLDEAVRALDGGELVIVPTDTVYGIACRPDDPAVTARLFEAKRRPRDLELPVLVPSIEVALGLAEVDDRAGRLMEAFWPGPLTIVLPRAAPARDWDLGGNPATIGLRRPRHLLVLSLLERTGPLAVTSANLSGGPTPASCEELVQVFGDAVAVYLCEEDSLSGQPSTVVELAHGTARVLRAGGIVEKEIADVLESPD